MKVSWNCCRTHITVGLRRPGDVLVGSGRRLCQLTRWNARRRLRPVLLRWVRSRNNPVAPALQFVHLCAARTFASAVMLVVRPVSPTNPTRLRCISRARGHIVCSRLCHSRCARRSHSIHESPTLGKEGLMHVHLRRVSKPVLIACALAMRQVSCSGRRRAPVSSRCGRAASKPPQAPESAPARLLRQRPARERRLGRIPDRRAARADHRFRRHGEHRHDLAIGRGDRGCRSCHVLRAVRRSARGGAAGRHRLLEQPSERGRSTARTSSPGRST